MKSIAQFLLNLTVALLLLHPVEHVAIAIVGHFMKVTR